MINPDERFFSEGPGYFGPRENPATETHCNVWDWDQLRWIKVKGTAKIFPPGEDVEASVLARFADYLSPEFRVITVDDDGFLTGVSTDPEEDTSKTTDVLEGNEPAQQAATTPFRFEWLQQLTQLVDFLNLELGIIHQDIAPRNLLVDPETDKIILFDFD
ncbi:unnamed protein product [Penicillium nalgiovense]|nr:unnamed protein product [Penicillium nalgiovense]